MNFNISDKQYRQIYIGMLYLLYHIQILTLLNYLSDLHRKIKQRYMKPKKTVAKYSYNTSINDSINHQNQLSELRQQLRQALEQLQQHKLSSQLQSQKRILIEHQYNQLKNENQEMRAEYQNLKKQLNKISKRYAKIRDQRNCQKCKVEHEQKQSIQREREIFMNERAILKNEIKELKKNIEMIENRDRCDEPRLLHKIEEFRRELDFKTKTIEEQRKVIRFLDDRLSSIQRQKIQTLEFIDELDQKLQQLQMQNNILKGHAHSKKDGYSPYRNPNPKKQGYSPCRKTGSIKNLQKLDKSRYSKDN